MAVVPEPRKKKKPSATGCVVLAILLLPVMWWVSAPVP
jgi:hypothetical protein